MEGKTKECQIKFRLTAEMKAKIEQAAARKDVSASWVIREALKKYFQEEER
jgi:predicted transcriptional regulator